MPKTRVDKDPVCTVDEKDRTKSFVVKKENNPIAEYTQNRVRLEKMTYIDEAAK